MDEDKLVYENLKALCAKMGKEDQEKLNLAVSDISAAVENHGGMGVFAVSLSYFKLVSEV